mmetsp:Transcript_34279/g.95662  ORF Transcript_34279/g.95662 Transcript_34279/m.95662 type:complete len:202 (+) Transcript_34279:70-675(+)
MPVFAVLTSVRRVRRVCDVRPCRRHFCPRRVQHAALGLVAATVTARWRPAGRQRRHHIAVLVRRTASSSGRRRRGPSHDHAAHVGEACARQHVRSVIPGAGAWHRKSAAASMHARLRYTTLAMPLEDVAVAIEVLDVAAHRASLPLLFQRLVLPLLLPQALRRRVWLGLLYARRGRDLRGVCRTRGQQRVRIDGFRAIGRE